MTATKTKPVPKATVAEKEERIARVKPLGANVLLMRAKPAAVSAGGILIPDIGQDKSNRALVLNVGPGTRIKDAGADGLERLVPLQVKQGDIVLIGKWSGSKVEIEGMEDADLLMVREGDIMAVLEDADLFPSEGEWFAGAGQRFANTYSHWEGEGPDPTK